MATPPPPRPMRMWEEEMLAEYLAARHPQARVINRVRLGPQAPTLEDPMLNDRERRLLGAAFRRWADAVVVDGGTLLVIETALIPDPRDISLVETYLRLVDGTPELADVARLPRRGVLVWGVDDPYARQVALAHGLTVDVFKPSHWGEFLAVKRQRERERDGRPAVTRL